MKKTVLMFAAMCTSVLSTQAAAADGTFVCPADEVARTLFQSGKLSSYPNYSEPPFGGARVQKQFPKTYLFGQAKYISKNSKSAAICQYSNHVGLVAQFVVLNRQAGDLDKDCNTNQCEGVAHWRKEYEFSSPQEEKPGRKYIDVCVITKKGIDYPSTECEYAIIN